MNKTQKRKLDKQVNNLFQRLRVCPIEKFNEVQKEYFKLKKQQKEK